MSRQKSQGAPPAVILHRDLSTGQQLGMLLPVCHTMMNFLLNPEREHENVPGKRGIAPGEAFIAAENTFRNACERIDKILGDSARWGTEYQLSLERQYNEKHDEQVALMRAQREAAEQQKLSAATVVAPHFRYKPALIPLEDGKWMAFLGNLEDLDAGILGVGDNPASALKSFDDTFKGTLSKDVVEWLAQHERNLESGVKTTLPFPKQNDNELDTNGTGHDGPPDQGGEDDEGDRHPPQ